ncbi:MAG: ferredoxin [Nitriliruptorales bacterium]
MSLELQVDRARCIGSGVCARIASGVFELDDEGMAVVIDAKAATRSEILAAAETCPTFAILVFQDGRRLR